MAGPAQHDLHFNYKKKTVIWLPQTQTFSRLQEIILSSTLLIHLLLSFDHMDPGTLSCTRVL